MRPILSKTYAARADICYMRAAARGAKLDMLKKQLRPDTPWDEARVKAAAELLEMRDLVRALKAKKSIPGVTYK